MCDVSFNAAGMRIVASGYAQKLPKYMALLLRRTLRHLPPTATSPALAAARRSAVFAAKADERSPPGRLDELRRASPEQLQQEMARLFGSVGSAKLLLAGALSSEAADALNGVVLRELEPLLVRSSASLARGSRAVALERSSSSAEELAAELSSEADQLNGWSNLLYKPRFATSYAANACLDPAIARALDQCGGL